MCPGNLFIVLKCLKRKVSLPLQGNRFSRTFSSGFLGQVTNPQHSGIHDPPYAVSCHTGESQYNFSENVGDLEPDLLSLIVTHPLRAVNVYNMAQHFCACFPLNSLLKFRNSFPLLIT
jgi:hypothetical protein